MKIIVEKQTTEGEMFSGPDIESLYDE